MQGYKNGASTNILDNISHARAKTKLFPHCASKEPRGGKADHEGVLLFPEDIISAPRDKMGGVEKAKVWKEHKERKSDEDEKEEKSK